ncbi:hypothetical protein BLA29_012725 [Euroglyphus maynei]|uniref:Uncharacterized protein n=1 Tax=Euroglyphus maynei TaxID=6958 RepID=A0A1Y3BPH3_EURMA|nr:hypothetical protein BLA29_012725 [Euroglyphus maynei]
MLVKKSRL